MRINAHMCRPNLPMTALALLVRSLPLFKINLDHNITLPTLYFSQLVWPCFYRGGFWVVVKFTHQCPSQVNTGRFFCQRAHKFLFLFLFVVFLAPRSREDGHLGSGAAPPPNSSRIPPARRQTSVAPICASDVAP
jgi:hypothetical protein